MYSLFDNKVSAYGVPIAFRDEDEARRELKYFIEQQDHNKLNPTDYEIFYIAEFDTNTGKYTIPELPEHILNCKQLVDHLDTKIKMEGVAENTENKGVIK